MTNLDRLMEFVLAGVFLCAGMARIFGYKRRLVLAGIGQIFPPLELSRARVVAIGLFEIVAALALVTPVASIPSAVLVPAAAAALALSALAACFYRVRHHQESAPTVALFLLAVFVVFGHLR